MKNNIVKFIAQLYALIPGDIKIIIIPATLTLFISYLGLAVDSLKSTLSKAPVNLIPLIVFATSVLVGLIGYLIKKLATLGQTELVKQGDTKTIDSMQNKIDETNNILDKAP